MLTTHYEKPTHVSHPTIDALVTEMRIAGRDRLIHYAGAAWRDDHAWQMCLAWVAYRDATEAELKAKVLDGAQGARVLAGFADSTGA